MLHLPPARRKNQLFQNHVLEITRGLPDNPTTEMDLLLWDTAQDHPLRPGTAGILPIQVASGFGTGVAKRHIFAGSCRHRSTVPGPLWRTRSGEIDLGRERWVENPTPVFDALIGYLKNDDPALAPDILFERGAAAAQAAIDQMALELRSKPGGWVKAPLLKFFARRVRLLMGIRESPKFFAVRMFNLVRQELLQCGRN